MIKRLEKDWAGDIDKVIRSRHYTWLAKGLGGEAVKDGMASMLVDIMHICRREGISWQELLERCQQQFELEEQQPN